MTFSAQSIHLQTLVRHHPLKRVFDLLFSGCSLFFGAPFFLFIALLVKCTSSGPIFYSSLRLGRGGKTIKCWKFRTMYVDARSALDTLLATSPSLQKEWATFFKLKNDPRITPIGRWLRKISLDELPQFWNVLKGDLSVVGPRPYLVEEIHNHVGVRAVSILSLRPGLTGLWQTSGRNLLSFEERVRLEEHYVQNHSLSLDLKLIGKTILLLFSPKGAY